MDYDISEYITDGWDVEYTVSIQHYDASYDTYELEITTLAAPNFFREPVVFIDSPEIRMSSSFTLPALFFESLRAYESTYTKRGGEWKSIHHFLGEKQNSEFWSG